MKNWNWLFVVLMLGLTAISAPQVALAKDTKPAAATAAVLDLNTATIDQLNALPGIGAVKAKAIVAGRPYASIDDFLSKGVLSKSAYEKIKDRVTVSAGATASATKAKPASTPAPVKGKLDLNTATADELTALPGIGPVKAKAIVSGRPYASVEDVVSKGILTAIVFGKIKDEVTVSGSAAAKPAKAATEQTAQTAPAANTAKPGSASAADEANPPEPTGPIDLNTASVEELQVLPGIGPARAKAIVSGRPYASLADFESKGVVPKSTSDKLKGAIEVVPVAKAGSSKPAADSSAQQGTPGQIAAHKRIKMCGAEWRAAKASGSVPAGQKWPQYWSQCNTRLKSQGY